LILGVALAEAGAFDRLPAVSPAGLGPDQRFQPVHAVDHHRGIGMVLVEQGVERLRDLGVACR